MQFDYLPPLGPSDTLNFTGVFDGLSTNASPVSFVIQDLMVAPSVVGFSQSPTSQSYSSDVIVGFSKAIASCSVSPSNESVGEVTGFGSTQLSFVWTTGLSSSQTT